jgi:hypothetical protein
MPSQLAERAGLVVESFKACEPDTSTGDSINSQLTRVSKLELGTAGQVFELVACFTTVVYVAPALNVDSIRRAYLLISFAELMVIKRLSHRV